MMKGILTVLALTTPPPPSYEAAIPRPYFLNLQNVKLIDCAQGRGTGNIISNSRVLTAAHVIDSGGCTIDNIAVRVTWQDRELDVALVEFNNTAAYPFLINCSPLQRGRTYLAIGYAHGTDLIAQPLQFRGRRMDITVGWNYILRQMSTMQGKVYQGQSGGAVIDTTSGMIQGIVNTTASNGIPIAGVREMAHTPMCRTDQGLY